MIAVLHTNYGDITLQLDSENAPETCANFIQYAQDGFYNGTIFHRVINNFMVQGGGFTEDMEQKPVRDPIQNEGANGLSNDNGTVAMARTPDPHSATAQFFINVSDNHFLNKERAQDGWGYAVFGKVISGMETVERIKKVKVGRNGLHQDVPVDTVTIESVELQDNE